VRRTTPCSGWEPAVTAGYNSSDRGGWLPPLMLIVGQSKRMLAFEVYVNKVKVCTAGLDEVEFVGASLNSFVNQDGRPDERRL